MLLGYLLTMVDRRLALHNAYEHQLRALHGSQVVQTNFPRSVTFAEAVAARKPVSRWKPRSSGAKAICALAQEMEERVTALSFGHQANEPSPFIAVAGGAR